MERILKQRFKDKLINKINQIKMFDRMIITNHSFERRKKLEFS